MLCSTTQILLIFHSAISERAPTGEPPLIAYITTTIATHINSLLPPPQSLIIGTNLKNQQPTKAQHKEEVADGIK